MLKSSSKYRKYGMESQKKTQPLSPPFMPALADCEGIKFNESQSQMVDIIQIGEMVKKFYIAFS
jgi:hypothetical protein